MRFRQIFEKYTVRSMTKKDAEDAVMWKYDPPLDVYNSEGTKEAAGEYLDGLHFAFCDTETGKMLGFFCLGPKAQLELPDLKDIYEDESYTDIAIGLRPELVGKHLGKTLLGTAVSVAEMIFPEDGFRLTAAADNLPAMSLYKKEGFEEICSFKAEIIYSDRNGDEKTAVKDMVIMCRG